MPKKNRRAPLRLTALVVTLFVLLVLTSLAWRERHTLLRAWERATLPAPVAYQEAGSTLPLASSLPEKSPLPSQVVATLRPTPAAGSLPAEVNLAVPFTAQAPHARWDAPYKEFCEEASVLMAISYLRGETLPTPEVADQKMLAIQAFEEQTFGYYEDTTAAETATILREFYQYDEVALHKNPTVNVIKQALAAGKLVIVPAAGQQLGNPYFQQPGPLYHMFVIKGYTANGKFIVNDPGTRRGADFLYDEAVIMNAMHDWRTDRQIELGEKVVLIVG